MADSVRYMMEEMVPELEDFVKQKYFNKQEVKQIVKRRQDFEYLLKRKAALKEDYLRYIEYESKLDELREHRKTALGEKDKKKTLADYAIVRRIHFIFERAVRKFRSDLSIWTAWLEFCRGSNSNRRLGRVIGRALQIHPTEPGLWVYAAAWEFENNGNPAAARALMQQGLRMCKYSQQMWLDYFDMELMYVEKLVARRRILGLDVPQPQQPAAAAAAAGQERQQSDANADQQQDEDPSSSSRSGKDLGGQEDGEGPESAAEAAAAAADSVGNYFQQQQQRPDDQADQAELSGPVDLDPQAAVTAVLSGTIAKLVFQNAIKAESQKIANNSSSNYLKPKAAAASGSSSGLAFRAGFLEVLRKYVSPGVEGLRLEILDSIRQEFPHDPAAADVLARSACDPTDLSASQEDVQVALQHYEQMIESGTLTAAADVAAANTNETPADLGRQNKRRKTAQQQAVQPLQQLQQESIKESAVQLYCLYSHYLSDRLEALRSDESKVLDAAAAAQQLLKVFVRAHEAGAADLELYLRWVELAGALGQRKVALKASRLACEAYPSNAAAWHTRITLENQSISVGRAKGGSSKNSSSSSDGMLVLIKQGLQQVPAADAGQLWQAAFELCSSNLIELQQLQQMLLTAVTRTAVKGPPSGGLGATVGICLATVWRTQGADTARGLFKKLLLLPAAGGDMFRTMIELESGRSDLGLELGLAAKDLAEKDSAGRSSMQMGVKLTDGAVQRIRAVYDAWVAAYGAIDVELWLQYALFEQQNSRQGPGGVYYRAVKALQEPDAFVQQYRSRVGLV